MIASNGRVYFVRALCGTLLIAMFCLARATSVSALEGMQWFGNQPQYEARTDRSFVRRWQANPPKGFPTLSPRNVAATKRAIAKYKAIVKAGGWKPLPKGKLVRGSSGSAVGLLRARLTATGELEGSSSWTAEQFDYYLEKALMRFQASNGLAPTGIVDRRTRAALNVSAKGRLRQLTLGLSRLRKYTRQTRKGRYVVVNIPAAQIEAIESDTVVSRHAGVVGKIDRKTPILTSRIHALNFNPVWRLPPTVVRKDLIPKGRRMQKGGKSVLVKYGIDAYDGSGRKLKPQSINWNSSRPFSLSYRQQPGEDNPLGFLKINFHNGHSVYMHDTPSETIFGRSFRAASSGCVRVLNIETLAAWVLAGQKGWDISRVNDIKESGKRLDLKVKRPVRLYFAYITAWATEDGIVQFRRDLYRRDGIGDTAAAY